MHEQKETRCNPRIQGCKRKKTRWNPSRRQPIICHFYRKKTIVSYRGAGGGRRRAWSTGLIYIGVSLHSVRINTAPTEKAGELQKQTRWRLGFFFFPLLQKGPCDIATVAHHISSVGTGKKSIAWRGRSGEGAPGMGEGDIGWQQSKAIKT